MLNERALRLMYLGSAVRADERQFRGPYRLLGLKLLVDLGGMVGSVPGGGLALRAVEAALDEWSRKAELSSDRAGLLAGQDPAAALRAEMKLASGGHLGDIDATAFLEQAREDETAGDLRDSLLRLAMVQRVSHPFPVVRAGALRRSVDEGTARPSSAVTTRGAAMTPTRASAPRCGPRPPTTPTRSPPARTRSPRSVDRRCLDGGCKCCPGETRPAAGPRMNPLAATQWVSWYECEATLRTTENATQDASPRSRCATLLAD